MYKINFIEPPKRARGLVFEQKWLLLSECLYGIYGHVPILGVVEGPFLTALGYYW